MSDLKGTNLIDRFRESAQRIASRIEPMKGIEGIVFMGALVRGFADKMSDLDITVFTCENHEEIVSRVNKIARDEEDLSGFEADVEVHSLRAFAEERWPEIRRWDFANGQVVHDPRGEVQQTISRKLTVTEGYWLRRIVPTAVYMEWYCCPMERDVVSIADLMMIRGSDLAGHHQINYGVELLLKALFAANREFRPPPKWRVIYSRDLRWLPKHYDELLSQVVTAKDLSHRELLRRQTAMRALWTDTSYMIEDEWGLTRERIRELYVRKFLKQTLQES